MTKDGYEARRKLQTTTREKEKTELQTTKEREIVREKQVIVKIRCS